MSVALVRAALDVAGLTAPFLKEEEAVSVLVSVSERQTERGGGGGGGRVGSYLEAEAVSAKGVAPAVVWSVAVEGACLGAAVAEEASELCVDASWVSPLDHL